MEESEEIFCECCKSEKAFYALFEAASGIILSVPICSSCSIRILSVLNEKAIPNVCQICGRRFFTFDEEDRCCVECVPENAF